MVGGRVDAGSRSLPSWLAFPRVLWLAIGLRLSLWLPWLFVTKGEGVLDEYWIAATLSGFPPFGAMSKTRLFQFADGSPEHLGIARGTVPWFAHPQLKIALFRPLAELTHQLDHAMFGVASAGAYIHSLLWSIALLALAGRFYERLLPSRVAGTSLLVLALSGCHIEPTGWIPARNASIAAALGLSAMLAHLAWRRARARSWRLIAIALFGLALLGGEAALGVLAFLGAYEAVVPEDSWPSRVRAFAPFAAVTAVWLAAYLAMGFGTHASGVYLNVLNEPREFFTEAPGRFFALCAGGLAAFPTPVWFFRPELRGLMVALGVLALGVTAFGVQLTWHSASRTDRRSITWLVLSSGFALLPQVEGALGSRSLLVPSLGIAPVVAFCLVRATDGSLQDVPWLQKSALWDIAFVHLVAAPLNWWGLDAIYWASSAKETAAFASNDLSDTSGKHVVVLACADPKFSFYMPMKLELERGVTPASWNVLSAAYANHRLRRTGPSSFELEERDDGQPDATFELFFRSPSLPLRAGERVSFGVATAEVLAMRAHARARVAFTFDRPLDDSSLYVVAWQDGALRHVRLPDVGGSLELPFERGPWML